ncbi:MAG: hypothetical protein Q9Q40_00620 [Acidobacteriota bacterium]|nr:hypothetical protein [Acidobacteriota bacterium]
MKVSCTPRVLLLALPLLILLGACASTGSHRPDSHLSAKLTPFTYYDEGDLLFIGVDTRAAQYISDESIFPLGIALVNKTLKSMTIDRESFVLEDDNGKRYPLVSHKEYRASYRRSKTDEQLADNFIEAMRGRFATFSYRELRMFPATSRRSTTSTSAVEVRRRQMVVGYVYFPVPENGLHKRDLKLLFKVEEQPETFVVRFSIR